MKRNDIKKLYFKGKSVTVSAITKKAGHLGLSDAHDADYTESEAYRIAEVIREDLAHRRQQPTQNAHSKVVSLPFTNFRQAGDEQFNYFIQLINELKKKFNNDLDEFEKTILNNPEKAAELAKSIDQLLGQIETGSIAKWTLKGMEKPRFNTNLSDIYPARLAHALKNRL
ncbi:MAG: hypothetical protein DCF17_11285 [Shackletoniella antarctica]|jgi:hypothetical protein|uniref:Uncharacterized protein n=1 Tax=Shackletoniella antarctica TaxID=268115 RepID=A0A2W4W745_9CYAN|nr:MAG: hypothetical protein DCF17_11285 [Shackletoniella antarctica]